MKTSLFYSTSIIFISVLACTNSGEQVKKETEVTKNELQDTTIVTEQESREMPPPIIITDLDQVAALDWTSSVLNKSEGDCYPAKGGQYGCYHLIDRKAALNGADFDKVRVGELIIYRQKGKLWTVDDTTQRFQSITLRSDILAVWDSIFVGLKKEKLIAFIGSNIHYQKGTILHVDFANYSGDFTITGDTIQQIELSKKCNE